jgi:hypothetical protein
LNLTEQGRQPLDTFRKFKTHVTHFVLSPNSISARISSVALVSFFPLMQAFSARGN